MILALSEKSKTISLTAQEMQGTLAHHQANRRKSVSDNVIKSTQGFWRKTPTPGRMTSTIIERFAKPCLIYANNHSMDGAENIIMEGKSAIAESYIDGVVNGIHGTR